MTRKKDNNRSGLNEHLNDEDRQLWQKVSNTAEPLHKRPELPKREKVSKNKQKPTKTPVSLHDRMNKSSRPTAPSYSPSRQTKVFTDQTPGVEKGMKRKLGRGKVEIDARLDLHGKSQAQAHHLLKSFLVNAQWNGHRTVLVITGKGEQGIARHTLHSFEVIHTPERAGVLMRCVPQWLNEPEFKELAVGYQPAHPKHGGGGALYVRVRRKR